MQSHRVRKIRHFCRTLVHREALELYSHTSCAKLNHALIEGKEEALPPAERQKSVHIDRSIHAAGLFNKPITVWRGLRFESREAFEREVAYYRQLAASSGTKSFREYLSTSLDPRISDRFAKLGESQEQLYLRDPHPVWLSHGALRRKK